MATEVMSTGTVNEAPVYPREIMKKALMYDAKGIMISHNHPSETLRPSQEDIALTTRVSQASIAVGIKLLDHIIVAGDQYYSFMEKGMMPEQARDFNESRTMRNDFAEDEETNIEI